MVMRGFVKFSSLAVIMALLLGCGQVVTVYWAKPGAGAVELEEDKEECQSLQRRVGLDEERIDKCLEAQGWSPVRQEPEQEDPETVTSDSEELEEEEELQKSQGFPSVRE